MSWLALFSTENTVENIDTSLNTIEIHTNENNEEYNWHQLTKPERRVCYH